MLEYLEQCHFEVGMSLLFRMMVTTNSYLTTYLKVNIFFLFTVFLSAVLL